MERLAGKKVVIVGGSSGIGLAAARLSADQGADVVLCSRSADRLREAQGQLSRPSSVLAFDSLDEEQVTDAFASLPSIDHLVVTAVADENKLRSPLVGMTAEAARRCMEKFWTSFFVARAGAPKIPAGGSITLTSSVSIFRPSGKGGVSVMSAASAAVAAFGRTLAAELAPVRVNVLVPGVVETGVWSGKSSGEMEQLRGWAAGSLPVGHLGQPAQLAEAVLYLMTNEYTTGHLLVVDGGLSVTG